MLLVILGRPWAELASRSVTSKAPTMQKLCQRHPAACIAAALALLCGYVDSYDMQQFSIHVYGNESHAISPLLFGIFFEEVAAPPIICMD